MKKGLTEIILVLDKSGSMSDIRMDSLGGINTFITEQKKVTGEANLTLVLFDTTFNTLFNRVNIKDTRTLTEGEYIPSGCTALLKAVSDTVDEMGKKLTADKEEDRPEKVILVVMTDGHENSSNSYDGDNLSTWTEKTKSKELRYTKEKLKVKLEHQQNVYKWKVIYLGADLTAFDEGTAIGSTSNFAYNATSLGTKALYKGINTAVSSYRETGDIDDSDLKDAQNQK